MKVATTLFDPAGVESAAAAGAGATLELTVGRPRIKLNVRVRSVRDGRYTNLGPLSAGVTFDMGRVAVLEVDGLTIVLQTRAVMANDQNMFLGMGVDLDALDAVILKGAAAVRAGWASRVARFVAVDTPGPTTADLRTLPYLNVTRPLWPLDEFDWRVPTQ
jgi:microcystin degradation protein MlrC